MTYLLALLVLVLTPISVAAQSSEPPAYAVGDEWKLSNGAVRKVLKVEGDSTVIQGFGSCPSCLVYVDKSNNLAKVENSDGSSVDSMAIGFAPVGAEWKMFQFPLETGKHWTFRAMALNRNAVQNYDVRNTVEAYEDVTTKAGTFKAFKITRAWTMMPASPTWGNRPFTWTTTEWFAPAAKYTVKWTSTSPNAKDWELASYTVK